MQADLDDPISLDNPSLVKPRDSYWTTATPPLLEARRLPQQRYAEGSFLKRYFRSGVLTVTLAMLFAAVLRAQNSTGYLRMSFAQIGAGLQRSECISQDDVQKMAGTRAAKRAAKNDRTQLRRGELRPDNGWLHLTFRSSLARWTERAHRGLRKAQR